MSCLVEHSLVMMNTWNVQVSGGQGGGGSMGAGRHLPSKLRDLGLDETIEGKLLAPSGGRKVYD